MTTQAPNWYREIIRDKVRARYQAMGGYLDGTMSRGDGSAGVIKFPVIGRVEAYELSGSIQKVKNTNPNLDMITVMIRDFEASAWMRVQDARRQGPNEQAAVGKQLSNAIRRQKDKLKLEALRTFADGTSALQDAPQTVQTIGDGSEVIDVLHALQAVDAIRGTGAEDEVFWPIPESWFTQLMMYKEFANADYVGSADLPFAKAANVRKRTWRNIHVMTLPNEYFTDGTGANGTGTSGNAFDPSGYVDTYMWAMDAVGNEAEWDQENMSLTTHADYEGSPMLGKVGLSGNSVGILPEGVKRLRFKAINNAARIPVLTETVA
jgi:hypothetical protein